MWVCSNHLKEVMQILKTPHIRKLRMISSARSVRIMLLPRYIILTALSNSLKNFILH